MIRADEALSIIEKAARPLGSVTVALRHAYGRVLAEQIVSTENVPPFDNAAMDGYAVRHDDLARVPATLRIVGEIAAGDVPASALKAGEAMSIMTGGMIPAGCSAVVQQEWAEPGSDGTVTIVRPVEPGHNIRKSGADIARGGAVFAPGTHLRPQELGVLASLGREFVKVARRPQVAILTTGSELVDLRHALPPGKIWNSNEIVLSALVEESGAEPRLLGIAKDEESDLRAKLSEGMKADLLITSGGVSVGKYDLVSRALAGLGVKVLFSKVRIKPGMPLLFGTKDATLVFGLPGNPVSGMVTFVKFVRPALRKMLGAASDELRLRARLQHEIVKKDGKRHFVRGILDHRDGTLVVRSTGSQVSNILSSLSKANCLIILPEEVERFAPDQEVEVELL